MKTSSPVSAYRKDEKGGLAVLVAFMTLALISITALAVDFGMAKAKRVSIQAATDMGALAGAHKLLVSGVQTSAVINEARNIALANDSNAAFGTPQLGIWLNGTFTTGGAGTPNAVRVTATGSVSTYFGGVLGFSSLNAAAESIAAVGAPVTASCVVPFGMEDITLTGHSYGDTMNIDHASNGNWGKIDIDGNMSSNPNFLAAMTSGFCSRSIKLGNTFNSAPGFAGVANGFDARLAYDPIITMPVVHGFSNRSSPVTVVGFVSVRLIMQQGNGNHWSGTVTLLDNAVGTSIAGTNGQPYGQGLGLVR